VYEQSIARDAQVLVAAGQSDWGELLACAEFAVNNAWPASIKNTPIFLK
jgi:hypothetical protein